MTDRVKGFTVTLGDDMREDDFEALLIALKMLKGVVHVEPTIVTAEDYFAYQRVRSEFRNKLYDFYKEL